MRGGDFCRSHQTVLDRAVDGQGDVTDELVSRRIASILLRAGVPEQDRAPPLDDEIGALRLVLARVLESEDDPRRLAASIPRIVDALVRATRAQRQVQGDQAEGLTEALTQVLLELGLGDEDR
ncbi:MAG: hypothetical protein EA415_00630 [Sphaerobacteraceae bacterium]|nr:MAG: hypothetical protein EA415_00630 [Sphaerobacteraceae bacterium]